MISQIVILAGGHATRLYPITQRIPKSIVLVAKRPFIAHQLMLLKNKGMQRVVICIGVLGNKIQEFVKDGSQFGLSVCYSSDGENLLGTGGALQKALPLLDERFFVIYGDAYLDTDFKRVSDYFSSHNKNGLMTIFKNQDRLAPSNIVLKDGRILHYDKKTRMPDMRYIDYGLSILKKEVFESGRFGVSFDLGEVYKNLIARGEMLSYEVKQRYYEIGSPKGLRETEAYLAASR